MKAVKNNQETVDIGYGPVEFGHYHDGFPVMKKCPKCKAIDNPVSCAMAGKCYYCGFNLTEYLRMADHPV